MIWYFLLLKSPLDISKFDIFYKLNSDTTQPLCSFYYQKQWRNCERYTLFKFEDDNIFHIFDKRKGLRVTAPAAVVHLNFRAGSTFPVPVCTVSPDIG